MVSLLTHICVTRPQWVKNGSCFKIEIVFVKLKELHIVTARKPRIHQNQPVAQYLHKIQPCMLLFMPVDLHHSAWSWKLSTGNEVIGKFNIPADDTNAFGNPTMHTLLSESQSCVLRQHPRRKIVPDRVGSNNPVFDYCWLMCTDIEIWLIMLKFYTSACNIFYS